VAAVLLAVVIIVGILLITRHQESIDTIAVLPFKNVNVDIELEPVYDGISESIIRRLAQLASIKTIIAWNSVLGYKGKETAPQEVGREQSVDAVLVSRIQQQENVPLS